MCKDLLFRYLVNVRLVGVHAFSFLQARCVHACVCLCVYTDARAHSTLHLDSITACMHTCTYEFKGKDVKRILRTCPADCWEWFVQCLYLRFRTHASARVRDVHMRILLRMKMCVSIHLCTCRFACGEYSLLVRPRHTPCHRCLFKRRCVPTQPSNVHIFCTDVFMCEYIVGAYICIYTYIYIYIHIYIYLHR